MTTAAITTRNVSIFAKDGTRLKKVAWGRVVRWNKAADTPANLQQAIAYAKDTLRKKRIGTIVYVGGVPVYHAKWGGKSSFAGWKSNPVAGMWRKKLPNV